ncbi:MAG: orotidine-5'-phosphate decarboxylase [Bdellovibrio sp. CG12_big_fil_rev_8_21_14_0_65_39_13]|nr:MAG: orotidine-5'-phosphate decarboxylase [Bdellovibrio sp. CG22_combo_CG10-13_8_21_14_all_39_27]PIQ59490.1 MAG: orotidine-5'-phosphate decarboxylase [Bdellovibrio sp. CG12_big_fil_rev_8_21_14_0_65_39_13]PIR33506.1 MAG: orotidine-5'-phosphate decarboxylase [Bdellovibrio sp. CG11_big_fil_rev_8_21_14_0_20_39_38]
MSKANNVIVALDNMTKEQALAFSSLKENTIPTVKIGLELFNHYGPEVIKEIYALSKKEIFLDLKLHDIPNTVEKAILGLDGLPIKFLTVHLSGGHEMLVRAKAALEKINPQATLLGVSILTSLGAEDINEMSGQDFNSAFQRLLNLAKRAGVSGLVSSAQELPFIADWEAAQNYKFTKVCPGIRFSDESSDDQKRVLTPQEAFKAGANYLVMGRSLTRAKNLAERISNL